MWSYGQTLNYSWERFWLLCLWPFSFSLFRSRPLGSFQRIFIWYEKPLALSHPFPLQSTTSLCTQSPWLSHCNMTFYNGRDNTPNYIFFTNFLLYICLAVLSLHNVSSTFGINPFLHLFYALSKLSHKSIFISSLFVILSIWSALWDWSEDVNKMLLWIHDWLVITVQQQ